jgi:hypothetical protein
MSNNEKGKLQWKELNCLEESFPFYDNSELLLQRSTASSCLSSPRGANSSVVTETGWTFWDPEDCGIALPLLSVLLIYHFNETERPWKGCKKWGIVMNRAQTEPSVPMQSQNMKQQD